jgi:hypothetical protein
MIVHLLTLQRILRNFSRNTWKLMSACSNRGSHSSACEASCLLRYKPYSPKHQVEFQRTTRRYILEGSAISQAINRLLLSKMARLLSQVNSGGICGRQSGTEADFLRVLGFPLPILIPPNAPCSSIIRGWYNRPISGRSTKWTQSHPTT